MPYDPNFPPDHQPLNAAPFRDQFNALQEEIILRPTFANLTDAINVQTAGIPDSVPALGLVISDPAHASRGAGHRGCL